MIWEQKKDAIISDGVFFYMDQFVRAIHASDEAAKDGIVG